MHNLEKLKERLTNQGKKADEVNAAIEAIEGLSKSWRGSSIRLPPDHILQMAKAVGELPSERIRAAVLADAERHWLTGAFKSRDSERRCGKRMRPRAQSTRSQIM